MDDNVFALCIDHDRGNSSMNLTPGDWFTTSTFPRTALANRRTRARPDNRISKGQATGFQIYSVAWNGRIPDVQRWNTEAHQWPSSDRCILLIGGSSKLWVWAHRFYTPRHRGGAQARALTQGVW